MCGGVRRTRCRALLLRHYQKLASHSDEQHLFWISIAHARRAVTISRRPIVCTASATIAPAAASSAQSMAALTPRTWRRTAATSASESPSSSHALHARDGLYVHAAPREITEHLGVVATSNRKPPLSILPRPEIKRFSKKPLVRFAWAFMQLLGFGDLIKFFQRGDEDHETGDALMVSN